MIGSVRGPPAPEIGRPPASNINDMLIAKRALFGQNKPGFPKEAVAGTSSEGVAITAEDASAVTAPVAAPAKARRVNAYSEFLDMNLLSFNFKEAILGSRNSPAAVDIHRRPGTGMFSTQAATSSLRAQRQRN